MASLWQFFGLPDPEGAPVQKPAKQATSTPTQEHVIQQSISPPSAPVALTDAHAPSAAPPQEAPSPVGVQSPRKSIPLGWTGPTTAQGEPFHDLGSRSAQPVKIPTRALRYVSTDAMNRLPTRQIGNRIGQGDTVIVDLRPLVHMDTHQNVCRRELKQLSDDVGVGVFALDAEDKLLLLPGNNVVVDLYSHELGVTGLLKS
jgi:hypothetical protein